MEEDILEPPSERLEEFPGVTRTKVDPVSGIIYADQFSGEEDFGGRNSDYSKVYGIGEGEYAYINPETESKLGFDSIETGDLYSCIAVGIGEKQGDLAMAHLDENKTEQLNHFLGRIDEKVEGEPDYCIIAGLERNKDFMKCSEILSKEFEKEKITMILGLFKSSPMTLGLDKGGFYLPKSGKKNNGVPVNTKDNGKNELTDSTQYQLDRYQRAMDIW